MGELVIAITLGADAGEQGVVNYLNNPDKARHEPGGGGVGEKESAWAHLLWDDR